MLVHEQYDLLASTTFQQKKQPQKDCELLPLNTENKPIFGKLNMSNLHNRLDWLKYMKLNKPIRALLPHSSVFNRKTHISSTLNAVMGCVCFSSIHIKFMTIETGRSEFFQERWVKGIESLEENIPWWRFSWMHLSCSWWLSHDNKVSYTWVSLPQLYWFRILHSIFSLSLSLNYSIKTKAYAIGIKTSLSL